MGLDPNPAEYYGTGATINARRDWTLGPFKAQVSFRPSVSDLGSTGLRLTASYGAITGRLTLSYQVSSTEGISFTNTQLDLGLSRTLPGVKTISGKDVAAFFGLGLSGDGLLAVATISGEVAGDNYSVGGNIPLISSLNEVKFPRVSFSIR
jgi:hypothetical protein